MIATDCQIKLAEGSTIVAMISRAPGAGGCTPAPTINGSPAAKISRAPGAGGQVSESHHVNDCSLHGTTRPFDTRVGGKRPE